MWRLLTDTPFKQDTLIHHITNYTQILDHVEPSEKQEEKKKIHSLQNFQVWSRVVLLALVLVCCGSLIWPTWPHFPPQGVIPNLFKVGFIETSAILTLAIWAEQ